MVTILGPTACGKTKFAARLATELDGEIVSADSRQVYRGMDIGTGKDLSDYTVGDKHVPYHLIDICEPGDRYSVFHFQQDFLKTYSEIVARGNMPILCGGTGLYIESIARKYQLDGLTEENKSQLASIQAGNTIFGLKIDRELRRERISRRLRARLDEGMVDEIRHLLNRGITSERLIRYGLEYKYVTLYVIGAITYDEMLRLLEIAIHQFAKRQMTYFRGMEERRGVKINWIDSTLDDDAKIQIVKSAINYER